MTLTTTSRFLLATTLTTASACSDDGAAGANDESGGTTAGDAETSGDNGGVTVATQTTSGTTDGGTTTGDDSGDSAPDSSESGSGSGAATDTLDTTGGDSSDGSTTAGETVTIYDIQDGTIAVGTVVTVVDVVVTGIASNGIFVQDPASGQFSGLFVFAGGTESALGDVVDVNGAVEEFNGLTEINAQSGSVVVTSSPGIANVPAAEELSIAAINADSEPWEAVRVRISAAPLTVTALTDIPNVNEFTVEDAGNALLVDDFIYDTIDAGEFAGFGVGATFTAISGPLNFSFDAFKVAPTSAADLEGFQAP